MIIRNGRVLRGTDQRFVKTDLYIEDGMIKNICDVGEIPVVHGEEAFDASGLMVLPGFIDTHIHGFVGVEFAAADEDFEKARIHLAGEGITGLAPTVRAMPIDDLTAAEKNILREAKKPSGGAKLLGIHMEGPFVSLKKNGAMTPPDIPCTPQSVCRLAKEGQGLLKLMTFAPERENAQEVIKEACRAGVKISMGHTEASYAQSMAAIEAGAGRATHVFNAMRPLYHRETGILGAVLTDDRVVCEMICDLVHLDEAVMRIVYGLKGAERITVISDAGAMSGLGDGEYMVGGRPRIVKDGKCYNPEGRIAGSCVSMMAGARNLLRMGIPMEEISVMCSLNPARALDADEKTGSLCVGKAADVLVCDENLGVKAVFVDGKRIV